jgi:hypothetical protein
MSVNVPMGALGMGIVRLVWNTIEKMAPVQIAGKPGMRTRNRAVWFDHTRIARFVEISL